MSDSRRAESTFRGSESIYLGVVGQVRALLPPHLQKWHVDEHGCWVWEGYTNNGWSGATSYKGRKGAAHRLIWEIVNGRHFAEGKEADHVCQRGRFGCVNPFHITESDHRTNMYRNPSHAFVANALKTTCKNGHDLTDPDNIQKQSPKAGGGRMCKACNRRKTAEWLARNKDELNERRRREYAENREKHLEQKRKWREANREKRRGYDRARRERLKREAS